MTRAPASNVIDGLTDLIKELRDAADEEANTAGVQQDFYHAELLLKAADALATVTNSVSGPLHLVLPEQAKVISRKPSDQEVRDICWQINRKQSADRVDPKLVQDVWNAIVYISPAVPGVTVSYPSHDESVVEKRDSKA